MNPTKAAPERGREISAPSGIWAVVPVKETTHAKQRLASVMAPDMRRVLALTMLQDVLAALVGVPVLHGIAVVTVDRDAARIARDAGARVLQKDAIVGHTEAIAGAARLLQSEGAAGMLAIPGDIPLVTSTEVAQVIASHGEAPAFTIVPAWDGRGSNGVLCSPPGLVPLQFGDDSCLPHLAAAESLGLSPRIVRLAGIGLDIDTPRDLAAFLERRSSTRTQALLTEHGFASSLMAAAK
ncbi:MAG: 2-phospho-L-lactate guanylyltransferase [Lautropia sp.]